MPTKRSKAFQFSLFSGLLLHLALISSGCSLSTSLSSLLSQAPTPIQLVSSPTINSGNQNAVTIGGSCTEGVTSFSITSPPPTQTVNCVNGSWSATVDVSGSPDGNVPIITDLTDARTGQPVIVQVAKDTQPPTVSGFVANNAITLTKLATIPYVATGTDIDEVYVTESATCASGGSWKPSSDDFSLSSSENTKSLYAKARDAAGNESACASVGAITLDQTPPVITGLSDDFTVKASKSWSWGCTEANGPCEYRSTISTLNTQSPLGAYSSTTTASQSSVDGIYYLAVQARDAAGNESTVARVQASLSSSLPSLSIENGANFHTSSNVTLYLTNIGSFDQVELSNAASCASPTILTPAGTLAWSLTAGEGSRSVSYRFRNTATSEVTECLDDSITIDSVRPTATLSSAFPVNTKSAITVSVIFSESVTGFALTDLNITNAVASSLAGSGASYSFTLTPSSQGAFSVELPANTANDTAGNLNTASNTLNYTYDSVAPTVTLTTAHSPYYNSSPLTFTATFNESVTGFTNADLTIVNGSATVSGSGPYTVTVTPAAAGDVSVTVNAGAAEDAATNASTASNTLTIYYDNINPTVPTVSNDNKIAGGTSSPLISWSGASDAESGILKYEVALGTSSGASDIVAWTNVGTSTSHTFTSLSLTGGTLYYPSVRVVDNANNTSAVANGIVFRYFVPPTITSVSPASGPIAGGTSITITGTQFYATMSVTIDGNACTSVSVASTTSMTCTTPAGTTGAKDIIVTNSASQSVTSTGGFSYVEAPPILISASRLGTCGITNAGAAKCWGSIPGNGTAGQIYSPQTAIGLESDIKSISGGNYHTCALKNSGEVWCWGIGDAAGIGNSSANQLTAISISLNNVIEINSGGNHTCALLASGAVKCWGTNDSGQLGDGTTVNRPSPVDVIGLPSNIKSIDAGFNHTCAVTTNNNLYCWGANAKYELGDGTTVAKTSATLSTLFANNVKKVSAGANYSCVVLTSDEARCWGDNTGSHLGDGTTTTRSSPINPSGLSNNILQIETSLNNFGYNTTCALLADKTVKCWGNNAGGTVGSGSTANSITTPTFVSGLNTAEQISLGALHACAITTDGSVKCWGVNDASANLGSSIIGQIGTGSTTVGLYRTPQNVINFP